MVAKIEERAAFTFAGLRHSSSNESNEVPHLWIRLGPKLIEVQYVAVPISAFGVIDGFSETTGTLDYLAGLAVHRADDLPEGMASWEISGATCDVFTFTLPIVGETHARIRSSWLPESGFERAPGPELELHGEDFDPRYPGSNVEIYIPIQRLGA